MLKQRQLFKLLLLSITLLLMSCNHNDDNYYDYRTIDSELLKKSQDFFDTEMVKEYLRIKNINLDQNILWDQAIINKHTKDDPAVINVPVERNDNKILQRLIFTYNNQKEIVEGQLWTFSSEKDFLTNYKLSYTLELHNVAENFVGDIIIWDMNTNLLKKTEGFDYKSGFEAKKASICSTCHNQDGSIESGGSEQTNGGEEWWGGGSIDLEGVVITSPEKGDDWQFVDSIFWNPVWGGGTIPIYNSGIWEENSQKNNKLCGSYSWKTIGNANVVNIQGLGLFAWKKGAILNAQFANLCVTIPNYNVGTNGASLVFNQAWNATMNQVFNTLNNPQYSNSINAQFVKNLIKQYLPGNLNNFAGLTGGSNVSEGPCPGTNSSQASYCL